MRFNTYSQLALLAAYMLAASCATTNNEGTLGSLSDIKFELKEEKVDGSLEKAMASYEKFLKETPETEMTPEALRRLADLKIQKEYEAEFVEFDELLAMSDRGKRYYYKRDTGRKRFRTGSRQCFAGDRYYSTRNWFCTCCSGRR